MMDHSPMKEALKRRKGRGIDITITVDPQGDKQTDLAPKGEEMGKEGEDPMHPEQQDPMHPEQDDLEMLGELTDDMSDHEKQMSMEPGHKPQSLGGRARMEALAKLKHGK